MPSLQALSYRCRGNAQFVLQNKQEVTKAKSSRRGLESPTVDGDSPVGERRSSSGYIPSSASPVEPGVNLGGPPPKAKYKPMTDSALVA